MFEIEYNLSNITQNVSGIDEMSLRYDLFLGSLFLKTKREVILIDWGWVPILDFAYCLLEIYDNLLKVTSGKEEFEFTESDEKICFQKEHDEIKIFTTFSDTILDMSLKDFKSGINRFYVRIVSDISNSIDVANSPAFKIYLLKAKKIQDA